MPKARIKLPPELAGLLRSDLERVITEANLGKEDTGIATKYLIEQIPQIDIAEELGMDRSTISMRVKGILRKLAKTAGKIT